MEKGDAAEGYLRNSEDSCLKAVPTHLKSLGTPLQHTPFHSPKDRRLRQKLWLRIVESQVRKGTDGVDTNGVTAIFMFSTEGLVGYQSVKICQHLSILRTFFPNLSKLIAFAATPLVLTPFVRNQIIPHCHDSTTSQEYYVSCALPATEHATDNPLEHTTENPRLFLRCRFLVCSIWPTHLTAKIHLC